MKIKYIRMPLDVNVGLPDEDLVELDEAPLVESSNMRIGFSLSNGTINWEQLALSFDLLPNN